MKYALIGCGRISPNHIEAAKNNVSANKSTENNIPPVPFPRKLNPFEKSFLGESDDTSSGGNLCKVFCSCTFICPKNFSVLLFF